MVDFLLNDLMGETVFAELIFWGVEELDLKNIRHEETNAIFVEDETQAIWRAREMHLQPASKTKKCERPPFMGGQMLVDKEMEHMITKNEVLWHWGRHSGCAAVV